MTTKEILEQVFEFSPYNRDFINFLKKNINRALPLIGAGMSQPFGCPSLNELVKELAKKWFPKQYSELSEMIETAIKSDKIYEVIDTLDGLNYFNKCIHTALQQYFKDNPPDLSKDLERYKSFEKIIYWMYIQGASCPQLILTTNYDSTIESVVGKMNEKFITPKEINVFSPNQMLGLFDIEYSDKLKILKFHGDSKYIESLVFKSDSFKAKYSVTEVQEVLRKMVASHSIVFFGCSLKEDLFIELFRDLSSYSLHKHYAILEKPEDNIQMQELETHALRMRTSIIWIEKGKYEWVDAIIDHLFTLSSYRTTSGGYKQDFEYDKSKETETETDENAPEILDDAGAIEEFFRRKINVSETEGIPIKHLISIPMYKIDGGLYEIYLVSENGTFYLSDEGATLAELDKIFELSEPDVIKNLVAILVRYNCKKVGKNITIECTHNDVHIKMSYLIQAISFMLNMKIFYV